MPNDPLKQAHYVQIDNMTSSTMLLVIILFLTNF